MSQPKQQPPSSPPRILLAGDVLGRLNLLFKRVLSVHNSSAGPFDALFCVGQFFPLQEASEYSTDSLSEDEISEYIDGRASVPIPTYFTGDYGSGASRLTSAGRPSPVKLCDNLFCLRRSGKLSLYGLSVVYLSGRRPGQEGGGGYSQDDVDAIRAIADEPGIVDLFLTNEWPTGVTTGSDINNVPPQVLDTHGCDPVVAELVAEIKPRYHVAGTNGVFYTREPYANDGATHVTRFIGLGMVGNKGKHKYIHAISPVPSSSMSTADLQAKPPNTTLSPYKIAVALIDEKETSKRSADTVDGQYWRYDFSQKRQRQGDMGGGLCFKFTSSGSCSHGSKCAYRHDETAREHYMRNVCFDFLNKGKCERGPDCKFVHSLSEEGNTMSRKTKPLKHSNTNCWFCLSSPNVESHLILSIGESYYCALAKGPLMKNHVLLVPIEHCSTTLKMPLDTEQELTAYKKGLNQFFKIQGQIVVYFEWASILSSHANLQAVPVPSSKANSIKKVFDLASRKLGFEFIMVKDDIDASQGRSVRSQLDDSSSLFYVEIPGDGTLLHRCKDNKKFPAQFGREVLAGLLGMPDRADWRNCKFSKEEEVQMAQDFKKAFHDFDPAV